LIHKHRRFAANIDAKECKNMCIAFMLTVGRNRFPSTPILKKYSAAEASFGT